MARAAQAKRDDSGRPVVTYITLAILFVVLFGTFLVAIAMYYGGQNKQKRDRKDSDLACVSYRWTEWSVCDKACNPGFVQRSVLDKSKKGLATEKCPKNPQRMKCNNQPCPINASTLNWTTTWTDWIQIPNKKEHRFRFRNTSGIAPDKTYKKRYVFKDTNDTVRCQWKNEQGGNDVISDGYKCEPYKL